MAHMCGEIAFQRYNSRLVWWQKLSGKRAIVCAYVRPNCKTISVRVLFKRLYVKTYGAETIIAAKNGSKEETIYETCDLLYHLSVLLEEMGITWTEVMDELARRELKTGNLKQLHTKGDI